MKLIAPVALAALVAAACGKPPTDGGPPANPSPAASASGADWLLAGSNDERFARVAKQLRGFDVAMVEVGYRYNVLYFAGQDQNWELAKYQLEKIRTAIANGVERRPKRAASAKMIEVPLAALDKAATAKDGPGFASAFDTLTTICNTCHQAEHVAFINVAKPAVRVAPVQPSGAGQPQ